MSLTFHKETYRGCKIRIESDDHPSSPREWDNVGKMVCWHRRYRLGDEPPKIDSDEFLEKLAGGQCEKVRFWNGMVDSASYRYSRGDPTNARIERHFKEHVQRVLAADFVILPLYLYDHSGITMSTGKFSCPWDSGQVGFIYCTMEKARKEWAGLPDEEVRKRATECMEGEVEVYSNYLEGNVAGFIAEDPNGEHIQSVWGFYPDGRLSPKCWEDPISQAKSFIDSWHSDQEAERTEAEHWAARGVVTT